VIDFRYHVVSIIAVFLALALGLFVGSTSLQDAVVHTINSKANAVTRDNNALASQVHTLQGQVTAGREFDKALLPYAIAGRLSGQLVTVVSAPGTTDGVRKQVLAAIDAAGATVSADIRLQNAVVDPKQAAFLTALTERITVPGHSSAATAEGPARAAEQLAAVLGVRPDAHGVPPASVDTVLSAYSTGKLISLGSGVKTPRPGTLAVVLTGDAPAPTADPESVQAQQSFVMELLRDLDETALGAVLTAPTPAPDATTRDMADVAATTPGLTDRASTVSGVDTPAGLIATVYALAAQADGVSGRYGPAPKLTPLPASSVAP
jgi:hypothetical protein